MAEPTPEAYAAAMQAAFPGLPQDMTLDEAQRRLRRAVDAVWPLVEREVRAKVAAELRAALIAGERPPWAAVGTPLRAASVAEWAARIAEGGDTDGRQDR